jgi:hypothetical protein
MFVILQGTEMIVKFQFPLRINFLIVKLLNGILIQAFIQIFNNGLGHNMRMHNFRVELSIS